MSFLSLSRSKMIRGAAVAALAMSGLVTSSASATINSLVLNEIFFNPGFSTGSSSQDDVTEFIEIRGTFTGSASLDGYYIIFLENEVGSGSPAYGKVDSILDLSGKSLDANGFAVFVPKGSNATGSAPGFYKNTGTGDGYGYGASGSTIGWTQNAPPDSGSQGFVENSGFTAVLVRVDSGSGPALNATYGQVVNGVPSLNLPNNWTLIDSVGVQAEAEEEDGYLFGDVNFTIDGGNGGATTPVGTACIVNNSVENLVELEYVGRWGDSTGSDLDGWWAANLKKSNDAYAYRLDNEDDLWQGVLGDGDYLTVENYFDNIALSDVVTDTYQSSNHP